MAEVVEYWANFSKQSASYDTEDSVEIKRPSSR